MIRFADDERKVLRKVQLRGGFSDRNGVNPVSTKIQIEDFDERTRTLIHNRFSSTLNISEIGMCLKNDGVSV